MTLTQLDVVALRRWVVTARADLAARAAQLDRLNVFPVPDGDTGTNLLVTMDQALRTLAETAPTRLGPAARVLAQATLVAARGNSGVILSQLVRGVAEVVTELGGETLDGRDLAQILQRASDLARAGVSDPVEGTMLTVASRTAAAARRVADAGADLVAVIDAAVDAGAEALQQTPQQLAVLARAGVVDAGGAGYLIVLDSLQRVVHGVSGASGATEPPWVAVLRGGPVATEAVEASRGAAPAYEVMFLLDQSDDARAAALREALRPLGDSLIVAGGRPLWSVHVHTDDVAAVLNVAVDAGRPHRFSVTRFADQHAECAGDGARGVCRAVITEAEGLAELARSEGAVVPRARGGGLPSAADCVAEVVSTGATSAVILACSPAGQEVAGEAARLLERGGRRAAAPECGHPARALAALAVLGPRPAGDLDAALRDVSTAIGEIRVARVEPAGGGFRSVGDDGTVASGTDAVTLAATTIDAMLDEGGELVTLISGDAATPGLLDTLSRHLRERQPASEVTAVPGGGAGVVLWIGVE